MELGRNACIAIGEAVRAKALAKLERENVIRAYESRSSVLFAHTRAGIVLDKTGNPCRAMNGFASCFWAGFDGMTRGVRVPTKSSISYQWYMAGRECAKRFSGSRGEKQCP